MTGKWTKSNERGAINGMIFVERWPPPHLKAKLRHNCILREVRIRRAWDSPARFAFLSLVAFGIFSIVNWLLL